MWLGPLPEKQEILNPHLKEKEIQSRFPKSWMIAPAIELGSKMKKPILLLQNFRLALKYFSKEDYSADLG